MLHASWNQCFCDLYRQFVNGYNEAAPPAAVAGIHPADRSVMQRKCFEHAENIIQIVSDLWHHGNRDALLERDVGVCAFESIRIILFGASKSPADGPAMQMAIGKAQLCSDMMTNFYARSASARAMASFLSITGFPT